MDAWYNDDGHTMIAGQHLRELRAEAARERQARQLRRRSARPVRVHLGRLLIVAGETLVRQPLDTACVERA
jgi:hypothetical protein